eukprot:7977208-Alexandrium_andersonii.AAC.1
MTDCAPQRTRARPRPACGRLEALLVGQGCRVIVVNVMVGVVVVACFGVEENYGEGEWWGVDGRVVSFIWGAVGL